jgi:Divergent InlB B-repeat domain
LSVTPNQTGTIRLNTLSIGSGTNAAWSGLYFKGHPITLEAKPSPGFQFQAWEGLSGPQTNLLTLSLNGDFSLTARFAPILSSRPRFIVERNGLAALELKASGVPGGSYLLETSPDLATWTPRQALTLDTTGIAQFSEGLVPTAPQRFYRLRSQ